MANTTSIEWYSLGFYVDENNDTAFTAYSVGCRYHIIATTTNLPSSTKAGQEYDRLVRNVQRYDNGEDVKTAGSIADTSSDQDSGVDVKEVDEKGTKKQTASTSEDHDPLPEDELQTWMLAPLSGAFEELSASQHSSQDLTLQEWYHCPTRFCSLRASENGEEAEVDELEPTPELEQRMQNLLPTVTLPKYLTAKLSAPWFQSSDLKVLDCSDKPVGTPYHPCRVQDAKTKKEYFLKIVDNNQQPQPIKRELDILSRIEESKLHDHMHVPLLEGLVRFDESEPTPTGKKRIMGFLLTDIPSPTPLTLKLDKDVPQNKREAWAKEADRIKNLLHDHDIIWGDAKADNFVVDADDNLWVIDFGGSYTEGWVDPELNETEEGDDMGTDKVVNALKDPVNNVRRTEQEEDSEHSTEDDQPADHSKKRKRQDESDK
jgi:hypothetical protein